MPADWGLGCTEVPYFVYSLWDRTLCQVPPQSATLWVYCGPDEASSFPLKIIWLRWKLNFQRKLKICNRKLLVYRLLVLFTVGNRFLPLGIFTCCCILLPTVDGVFSLLPKKIYRCRQKIIVVNKKLLLSKKNSCCIQMAALGHRSSICTRNFETVLLAPPRVRVSHSTYGINVIPQLWITADKLVASFTVSHYHSQQQQQLQQEEEEEEEKKPKQNYVILKLSQ